MKFAMILVSCVIFMFTISQIGTKSYSAFIANDKFAQGTTIGSIDVGGLLKSDAEAKISAEVETWTNTGQISLTFGNENEMVPKNELLHFSIHDTVEAAISGQSTPLIIQVNQERLNHTIESLSNRRITSFHENELNQAIIESAAYLVTDQVKIDLLSYLVVGDQKVISESEVQLESISTELSNWVGDVKEISLAPHKTFSLLSLVSELGLDPSNESLSIIGTSIYQTILPSNIEIIERHISDQLPTYATLGFEARVEKESKDLMLYNANPFEYKLIFTRTSNGMKTELVGPDLPTSYRIKLGDIEEVKPRVIQRYDSKLSFGTSTEIESGQSGLMVKVIRVNEQGTRAEETVISEDYYKPIHKVVLTSLVKTPVTPTESTEENESEEIDEDGENTSTDRTEGDTTDGETPQTGTGENEGSNQAVDDNDEGNENDDDNKDDEDEGFWDDRVDEK